MPLIIEKQVQKFYWQLDATILSDSIVKMSLSYSSYCDKRLIIIFDIDFEIDTTNGQFIFMETTEKIVEAYCRYVKNWFTIANIKTKNDEIDILAVDTTQDGKINRYHIEVSVSISSSFSKLTALEFDPDKYKQRNNQAQQRRTIDYFINNKFEKQITVEKLKLYGFSGNNYRKVIVSWGWTDDAQKVANTKNIYLWDFRDIITEIGVQIKSDNTYFTDDTLRTIHLYIKAMDSKLKYK